MVLQEEQHDTSLVSIEEEEDKVEIQQRKSVNTRASILNVEDSDDEENVATQSFLDPPGTPPAACNSCYGPSSSRELAKVNTFSGALNSFDTFVDTLCFGPPQPVAKKEISTQLEYDFLMLLGCVSNPDAEELRLWKYKQLMSKKPQRTSLQNRARKVHQLRDRLFAHKPSPKIPDRRTVSFHDLAMRQRKPSEVSYSGYDSDPEVLHMPRAPPTIQKTTSQLRPKVSPTSVVPIFQQVWTLLWHQEDGSRQTVRVWMERGSMLNQMQTMIEPQLKWCFPSSPKLHSIKLLEISRLLMPKEIDRNQYPLVRPSCSMLVKTSDQSFVFEAPSTELRNSILDQWKLTVARFASLAVLEDMKTIYREFFTPAVHSQTLVPEY